MTLTLSHTHDNYFRKVHVQRGEDAMRQAEELVKQGKDAEARASYGSARTEFELAGNLAEKEEVCRCA